MGLQINLHAKLKEYFGFDHFKGNQEAIIKNVLAGNNTFVLMPTGGGKSFVINYRHCFSRAPRLLFLR